MRLKEEQRLAIEHGEGDLLVSASAGSGKTFVMINRAIRLILEGKARLSELLAVTFTEKAADEMKEKLMRAMIAAVNEGDEELREQLADLPSASVSTLHAFCANLLRNYFFAAGWTPIFRSRTTSPRKSCGRARWTRSFCGNTSRRTRRFYTFSISTGRAERT